VASHNDVNNQKVRVQATLISRASVSETTFRILVTLFLQLIQIFTHRLALTDYWTRRCGTFDS